MSSSRVEHGPHIDDGDLIRLLDGECSHEEGAHLRAHIDACPECRDTADSLKRASDMFSASMLELDIRAPAKPKREVSLGRQFTGEKRTFSILSSRVLRMAAVLALMVLAFTATPARAWLVQGWAALRSLVVSEVAELPETATAAATEDTPVEPSSILRFTPRGSEFRLEFTEYQAGGSLVLLIDSTESASAGVLGEQSGEELILLPNGLRVRNTSSSMSSYEVLLPLSLSTVSVSVAGNTVLRLDLQTQSAPLRRELNLTGSGGH
jgi:hypothetical protein